MWNLISCSKLTQEKIRQKSYDQHVNKVKRMKSKLKIKEPQQPWFVYVKSKKQLSRNDELKQIDKQNQLLLKKMQVIQSRQNKTFKNSTFLTTLNSKIMNDTNQQIYKENKRICQKIMKTEAFYKTQNILENTTNLQKVLNNISANSRRVQSAKSIALSRSKINLSQSGMIKRPLTSHSVNMFKSPQSINTTPSNESTGRKIRALSAHPSNRKFFINQQKTDNNDQIQN